MVGALPRSVLSGDAEAWAGHPDVRVAVLDGAVDRAHPCFAGADLVELEGPGAGPPSAHGTHVASLLFGQPGSPLTGIVPRCRGLLVPIYPAGPRGLAACSQQDLARAVDLAVDRGAHVINISGGELSPSGEPDVPLLQAIRRAADRGVIVVAAAGNDGCDCLHVPASLAWVIAVGATGADGRALPSTNRSADYAGHAILAPGAVLGAAPGGGLAVSTGTSQATALVSGVAAALLAEARHRGAARSPAAVRDALLRSASAEPMGPSAAAPSFPGGILAPAAAARFLAAGSNPIATFGTIRNNAARTMSQDPTNPSLEPASSDRPAPPVAEAAVAPSDGGAAACTCGARPPGPPRLAYALGKIGVELGSRAREEAYRQHHGIDAKDAAGVAAKLAQAPHLAAGITWTLEIDETPILALAPAGPFAAAAFDQLRAFLAAQTDGSAELHAVPGTIVGSARLRGGETVPVMVPELRGMASWTTAALVKKALPAPAGGEAEAKDQEARVRRFFERVLHELRNHGQSSRERALNFAATSAFKTADVLQQTAGARLELDRIEIEPALVARSESDAWDVRMLFFDPANRTEAARRVFRFTVDVSDVVPATVGELKSWSVY